MKRARPYYNDAPPLSPTGSPRVDPAEHQRGRRRSVLPRPRQPGMRRLQEDRLEHHLAAPRVPHATSAAATSTREGGPQPEFGLCSATGIGLRAKTCDFVRVV